VIQPSFVDKDVVVENSVIGPNVSIAKGVTIKDSVIRNSIIDENAVLENVMLTDSTIGSNVKIKNRFKKMHVGDSSQLDGF
jgi:glucose-1-phosphate thymidylyltransferase